VKSTTRSLNCPVLHSFILIASLLVSACGTPGNEAHYISSTDVSSEVAQGIEITGFRYEVSPPDTISIFWSGEGSGEVTDINVSLGQDILGNDTLALLIEDIHVVERERLVMEYDLASAILASMPEDSSQMERVDSLDLLLDSLLLNEKTACLSPLAGTVQEIFVSDNQRVRPGDAIADISVTSSRLYHVFPPSDVSMNSWPPGRGDVNFLEERPDHAVYSGELSAIEAEICCLTAVPREAVYENDLDSYIITVKHDTIPVIRVGMMNDLVIITPSESFSDDLLTWATR